MLLRSISILCLASFLQVALMCSEEKKYVYRETTGKQVTESTWTVKKDDEGWEIDVENSIGKSELKYTSDYKMTSFDHLDKKTGKKYQIKRDGAKLTSNSDATGVKQNRTYEIDNQTWVQDFDYGLKPLLKSDDANYPFVIVHPENLTLNHLIAKKRGLEEITVGDKTYNAQHVIITLEGFKSMFWEANVWYDSETHLLLKYSANEGPGTPMSTINFLEEK